MMAKMLEINDEQKYINLNNVLEVEFVYGDVTEIYGWGHLPRDEEGEEIIGLKITFINGAEIEYSFDNANESRWAIQAFMKEVMEC